MFNVRLALFMSYSSADPAARGQCDADLGIGESGASWHDFWDFGSEEFTKLIFLMISILV